MQTIVKRAFTSSVAINPRVLVSASTSCRASTSGRTTPCNHQLPGSTNLCQQATGLAPQHLRHSRDQSRQLTMTRGTGTHHGHGSKRVLVPIAHGTEEMEAVIIIDVLRRAGAEVVVASVEDDLQVKCSRGVKLVADEPISSAAKHAYDIIVLPGGMPGAERLRDCAALEKLLHAQRDAQKPYAAICAAPVVVLEAKGLLGPGVKATAHPAMSDGLKDQSAVHERVVVDKGGLLITSRGPGTAFEFSLELVKLLFGEDKMKAVAGPMVMHAY